MEMQRGQEKAKKTQILEQKGHYGLLSPTPPSPSSIHEVVVSAFLSTDDVLQPMTILKTHELRSIYSHAVYSQVLWNFSDPYSC